MWLLKDNSGTLTYLKPNETLTVGRNKGDIVLPNDGSISRVHAKVTVKPLPDTSTIDNNTVTLSTCTVEDANSKYGNFIIKDDGAEIKITENGYALQHMDRIRFGLQNYVFTVHYVPIITVTSGLNEAEKNELTQIIDAIGGKIMSSWTPMCTHMTIETPTISEKLSCALASCTPLVPIDYWKAALNAFQNNEEFPDPVEFASSINNKMAGIGNVDVAPNQMRKSCFQNLTFVHFTSKQYTLYNRMIKLAGGSSIRYGRQRNDLDVCNENVIVVQMVESNTTQATGTGDVNYINVCDQLGACSRRTIPECEIPLAILNCSTERYCNPTYNYAELLVNRRSEIPEDQSSLLALDTQDVDLPSTSGVQRRPNTETQSDVVKESAGQSCSMNYMSESSNYNCDSIGSMKLVSLNYEKNLENELIKRSTENEKSLKREREENVEFEVTKKRACLESSVGNEEPSQSVSHKSEVSYEFRRSDEEDYMCFVDEKIDIKDVPINPEVTPGALSDEPIPKKRVEILRSVVSEADSDVDEIDEPILPGTKRKAQSYRAREVESEERAFLKPDDGETLRKQKVSRSDTSPSLEVIENPRKRNKPMSDSEEDIFRRPQQKVSKKNIDISPARQSTKVEPDDDNWTEKRGYQPLDDSENKSYGNDDTEVSVFFPSRDDPNNTSAQRLLRITSLDDLTHSGVPKFGKCFRKRYTITPCRVDLYDATDDVAWTSGIDREKNTSFNDEEATTSRYVSAKISPRSKKMLRV